MEDQPRPKEEILRDAEDAEVEHSLAHALRFNGKKRIHHADDYMARYMAEHLNKFLKMSGYVIKKRPPSNAWSTGHFMPDKDPEYPTYKSGDYWD